MWLWFCGCCVVCYGGGFRVKSSCSGVEVRSRRASGPTRARRRQARHERCLRGACISRVCHAQPRGVSGWKGDSGRAPKGRREEKRSLGWPLAEESVQYLSCRYLTVRYGYHYHYGTAIAFGPVLDGASQRQRGNCTGPKGPGERAKADQGRQGSNNAPINLLRRK